MRYLITAAAMVAATFSGSLFAEMSKEPVIITECRSFGVRSDSESKIGLASRFAEVKGDCNDINKVNQNQIISVNGTLNGQNGIFALKAYYPDGSSYDHYILFKAFKNNPARPTELWMASSSDFSRSIYAIAKTETDKIRTYSVFSDSYVAPSVIPILLYSFGEGLWVRNVKDLEARREYDLGLLKIYESIVGGSEGFTEDFIKSNNWLDEEKRAAALKTLRDYTLANFGNIKVDNTLDAHGKTFADYMKIYSDKFVEMVKAEAELQGKKIELQNTFALDDATYQLAKEVSKTKPNAKTIRKNFDCLPADSNCRVPCSDKPASINCGCELCPINKDGNACACPSNGETCNRCECIPCKANK